MLIDVNTYLGNYPFRPIRNNSAKGLVELMDDHNIDKSCVSSINGVYYRDVMKGNYELLEEIAPYRERFVPVCNINPVYAEAASDFKRCIEELRFKGVKLFPKQHGYELTDEKSVEILKIAGDYGVFVQLPLYIEDLRQRHPMDIMYPLSGSEIVKAVQLTTNTNFILSNYSFGAFSEDFKTLDAAQRDRIYYDISRLECLNRNYFEEVFKFTDPDHLLFATGAPMEYIDVQLIKLKFFPETLGFSDAEIELVKSGNISKLITN